MVSVYVFGGLSLLSVALIFAVWRLIVKPSLSPLRRIPGPKTPFFTGLFMGTSSLSPVGVFVAPFYCFCLLFWSVCCVCHCGRHTRVQCCMRVCVCVCLCVCATVLLHVCVVVSLPVCVEVLDCATVFRRMLSAVFSKLFSLTVFSRISCVMVRFGVFVSYSML